MQLEIGRAWVIECGRCANEGLSYEETADEARETLAGNGWTQSQRGIFCPSCNGARH